MNDRKHHKKLEIGIYISLIIATGIMMLITFVLVAIDSELISSESEEGAYALTVIYGGIVAFLAFGASLILSVLGFITGPWLLRRHLLLWYACLFTLFLIMESKVSEKLSDFILVLGVVILLMLPVFWVRNASRREFTSISG